MNPRAFLLLAVHIHQILSLMTVKSSLERIHFFDMIQKVYVFFSSSTHRWQVVIINISNLTVKNLSQTRWGCRIKALKPFRHRIGEIYNALFEIVQDTNLDSITRHEAECLQRLDYDDSFDQIVLVATKLASEIETFVLQI
ncbi:zinc finger MYM-type protein 1-like [Aphis craccivora]|uniref:Zinc finger MYM-type protein 1-like n=1 Tax=Aphis craccivora TaxID=307492 RepID=A0A6G0X9G3_APHCR|nr:zinc finger MYM-type protein 1-like [Aphis craccivora]